MAILDQGGRASRPPASGVSPDAEDGPPGETPVGRRARRPPSIAALIVFLCASLGAVNIAAQNRSVDVLHYRIEVDVPAEGEVIAARVELTVKPVAPIVLDPDEMILKEMVPSQ